MIPSTTPMVVTSLADSLVLAAAGLYRLVSYVVWLRRQEVGIRLALGAAPGTVVTMIIRQALVPTLIGALVGATAAAAAGVMIRSRLHGASRTKLPSVG